MVKNQKFQQLIIEENQNWNLVDQEKDQIIAKKEQEMRDLKQEISQMDRHCNELNLELQDLRESNSQVDDLKNRINQIQDERKQFQQTFTDTLSLHEKQLEHEFEER